MVDNYPYAPDTDLCAAPAILSGSVTPRTGGRVNLSVIVNSFVRHDLFD